MRPISTFLLFILLLGCQDSSNESFSGPTALTAKKQHDLGEGIAITISNESNAPLLLQTCCGSDLVYHLDRYESGRWALYTSHDVPCTKACPSGILYVSQSHPHESIIGYEINAPGTYRFRLLTGDDSGSTKELTSNSFTVE